MWREERDEREEMTAGDEKVKGREIAQRVMKG